MRKSVHSLTIQDFRNNPIWHPLDDFEDPDMLVEPFPDVVLHLEEIYLVRANITLADKSEYEGYVRFSWGKPVLVALSVRNSEFVSFPAQRSKEVEDLRLGFLEELNKSENDVFPFSYQISVDIRFEGVVY